MLPDVMDYQGRRFLKARWLRAYVDVVAQYREDKPRDSGHLFVMSDGSVTVPHNDAWNPDAGPVGFVMHQLVDNSETLKVGGSILAGVLLSRWRRR